MNFNHYLPSGASLHTWQQQFLDKFIDSANKNAILPPAMREAFTLNAFPSAGKTWAQMVVIKHLLETDVIDLAVVVVPTKKLKVDFGDEALKLFGLMNHAKVSGGLGSFSPITHQVLVMTYQQLKSNQDRLIEVCSQNRVMVSADEMHHLGESKSWGREFRTCFENSVVRLMTTGTPFRSDGEPIPWVRVQGDKIDLTGEHAYTYGYGVTKLNNSLCALTDGVATPVVIHPWDGEVHFALNHQEFKHKLSDNLDEIYQDTLNTSDIRKLKTIRRKCAIECGTPEFPLGTELVQSQITEAHRKLTQLRDTLHPHASGMVVCDSINHADAVAKALKHLTGTEPVVIHGNEPNYSSKLEAFQNGFSKSRTPWLVSVNMVSEGVNIKHMRVLVYLTTVTAPMRWTQIVGRVIRYDDTMRNVIQCQEGHVYQYEDGTDLNSDGESVSARIKLFAETLLEEKEFTIKKVRDDYRLSIRVPDPDHPDDDDDGGDGDGSNPQPLPPQIAILQNLGCTGDYSQQIYEGVRHARADLGPYEILGAGWGEPPVMAKSRVDRMPDELREMTEEWIRETYECEVTA